MIRPHTSWLVLAALGVLSSAPAVAADGSVDTSQWACESCPFEKGVSGSVDAGVGYVSAASARFGDYTGLNRQGGVLLLGGNVRYRDENGLYAVGSATDLGLDARSISAEGGREGRYALRLGYDELPRHFVDGASTPYLGNGGNVLTLPAGFPAATTGAMPLATTLQGVDIGYKRSRFDLGGSVQIADDWSVRLAAKHLRRDGTQRGAGSFFSSATQLVVPVDQTTDELEIAATYAGRQLSATVAYRASMFRNAQDSLTFANPFTAGLVGAANGRLALPPGNQFHQLQATLGYRIAPGVQASGDIAVGRMTQDAAFLPSTINPALVVAALPASSLQGKADTLDATLRLSADVTDRVRLNGSVSRNQRDNRTPTASYPSVSTDMFVGPVHTNVPYGFTQDRLKLSADYRGGPLGLKASAGVDLDEHQRTLQEVDKTRDTTVFARVALKPLANVGVSLKLAHGDRSATEYRALAALDIAENPLLRKYNMAERRRDSGALRADASFGEKVSAGLDIDFAYDAYPSSTVGLREARTLGLGADVSYAPTESTQFQLYAHTDRIRSLQYGSQNGTNADWTGRNHDDSDVIGLSARHAAIKDKLDIGADFAFTRSRSSVTVDNGVPAAGFPNATTSMDSVKLFATYRLRENLSLTGSYWYERYDARDWHLDGVLPATVPNLLTFGEQPQQYRVNVVRVSMRYQF